MAAPSRFVKALQGFASCDVSVPSHPATQGEKQAVDIQSI